MDDKANSIYKETPKGIIDHLIWFCLNNQLVVILIALILVGAGIMTAPFAWNLWDLPRAPIAVDAIPDIGENQQIVFTEWPGRSPQDMEDQVTYPLTVALLGIPGVNNVRSFSMFGFSSIYVIFDEDIEFYWSRARIIEKLNSLPQGALPDGVQPSLGPDATALGQVYWYTLEGMDPDGNPAGGWDLHELRSIQDWYVRYGLLAAEGVSEVASVGGYVLEYQVDINQDAMRAHNIMLMDVFDAVRNSNIDVGARELELNQVEYLIRGRGFIESIEDIEETAIRTVNNVPIRIRDIANITLGPAMRRGVLDKEGAEAVGGVVVVRYGANPLSAIDNTKAKIAELAPGLPSKAVVDYSKTDSESVREFAETLGFVAYHGPDLDQEAWLSWLRSVSREEWPEWITISQVTIVPFYDRTGLIYETLGTLQEALILQILVTIIVVVIMVRHLRSSILISGILPMAVLLCFLTMKQLGVDANIVALSGIAIAIGTMVDMGIILCENILKHLDESDKNVPRLNVVYRAASEVGSAVLTAVATTVISFLPVFTMTGAEGKLFKPLAFTKTFALIASVLLALTLLPILAHLILARKPGTPLLKYIGLIVLSVAGLILGYLYFWWIGVIVIAVAAFHAFGERLPEVLRGSGVWVLNGGVALLVSLLLSYLWAPLGVEKGQVANFIFVSLLIGCLLLFFNALLWAYPHILRWCLRHKLLYMSLPTIILVFGMCTWLGFGNIFGFMPEVIRKTQIYTTLHHQFPGLGREFMPPLDEGSYLYMPTTMPHASIGAAIEMLQEQDLQIAAIPEVESVVGKIGRVESPLDPAPLSMVETVINYKPEYTVDENGYRLYFAYDRSTGQFLRDDNDELIPDSRGMPYRQWRDEIRKPDDIWDEIVAAAQYPGATSAPRLQPIAARVVMLQSGMRAPMGVKVRGPNLETIEQVGLEVEQLLKQVPGVQKSAVFADRIVGKPYLEIDIDRQAIARYGISIREVQDVLEMAVGGEALTTTVEGRERYPVRVRFMREMRDSIEDLGRIIIPTKEGTQIPLEHLADIRYVRGPEMIKSEDTFLVGYVLFDKLADYAEIDVVQNCIDYLDEMLATGQWNLPPGVSYTFAGNYENQIRAQRTLSIVLPAALMIIFVILYMQFKSVLTTGLVFAGIIVAWSGGFSLLWFYAQPWFMDINIGDVNLRDLFQISPINLSVAVWVGFLALFGIATDDGVVIATYLKQSFAAHRTKTVNEIREAVVIAGMRRVRPCLMTSATTILALVPVLTSTGRGSDIMVPMAIPSVGGMMIVLLTLFMVPVLFSWIEESKLKAQYVVEQVGEALTAENTEGK